MDAVFAAKAGDLPAPDIARDGRAPTSTDSATAPPDPRRQAAWYWEARRYVLRLSTVMVWGGDDFAGGVVRDGCADVFADQVQTQVVAGRYDRGGQDGVVVDIEDVAVDALPGGALFEVIGGGPTGSDGAAVE
ncbi:hypothetical protein ACFVJH_03570 [Streptomyces decoyicus]|uniref:hypothetical protein n=1 Tax=Streptomyces decoyicus TaxID=249567 RepID=UPI0036409B0F